MATKSLCVWMCSALLCDRLLFSILWNWVGHVTYTSSSHLKAPVSRACSLAVPGILGLPHEGAQAGPREPSGGEARHPTDSQLATRNTSKTIPSPETSLAHSCPMMHERVQQRSVQKEHPASPQDCKIDNVTLVPHFQCWGGCNASLAKLTQPGQCNPCRLSPRSRMSWLFQKYLREITSRMIGEILYLTLDTQEQSGPADCSLWWAISQWMTERAEYNPNSAWWIKRLSDLAVTIFVFLI